MSLLLSASQRIYWLSLKTQLRVSSVHGYRVKKLDTLIHIFLVRQTSSLRMRIRDLKIDFNRYKSLPLGFHLAILQWKFLLKKNDPTRCSIRKNNSIQNPYLGWGKSRWPWLHWWWHLHVVRGRQVRGERWTWVTLTHVANKVSCWI